MFDFGINVLLNPSSFIGPANQVIGVINQLQSAISKFNTGTGGGSKGLESDFARLNQVAAQTKATFESVSASSSNLRSSMAQIGQGATQASAGFSIFGAKLNESIQTTRNAEATFKALGPAFAGVSSSVVQLSSGLTPLGGLFSQLANNARATASAITPLGNILTGMTGRLASAATAATATGNAFRAGLSSSIASIGGPLNSLNSQLGATAGGLINAGGAASSSATGFGRLREMFTGNRGLVFGLSATFGTITGVVFELQLMGDANKQVAESQAVVNELIAQGKQGTGQYQQAVQALGKDQRFLEFATRNLALAFTNFIPDILLVTNGVIQLTDKFRTTGAAVAPAVASITQAGTAMTATATTTTALGTAQTALGTTFTSSGNAIKNMVPVFTGLRTEQAGLILTTNGLGASQAGMVAKTVLSRDAMMGLQGVMAATRAESLALAASNNVLGNSFLTMGTKATAGGGGIKGFLSNLLGLGAGGGIKGLLGAIGGVALPVAGALGFVAFADQFAKSATNVVNSRLLAEAEIEKANKGMSESFQGLGSDISTSIDGVTGKITYVADSHTAAANTIIANNAKITQSAGTTTVLPGAKSGQTVEDLGIATDNRFFGEQTPATTGKQAPKEEEEGWLGKALPQFSTEGQTKQATRTQMVVQGKSDAQIAQLQRSLDISPALVTQAGGFNAAEQQFAPTMTGRGADRAGTVSPLQTFMDASTQQGKIFESGTSRSLLPHFQGAKVGGELTPEKLSKVLELEGQIAEQESKLSTARQNNNVAGVAMAELEIMNLKATGNETLANVEANKQATAAQRDLEKSQSAVGKAVQGTEQAMQKHNQSVLAMPRALAAATGQELEYSRALQTNMGVAVVYDNELIKLEKTVQSQAAAYTNLNAVQGESFQVQQQVISIGNAVVGGVEQQSDAVRASAIFWKELNVDMASAITSGQEMTLANINVTESLTNQTKQQYLVNQGLIEGKLAAQQFIDQTISGVASNEQYHNSLHAIADTMGIKLPTGIQATTEELEAAIVAMRETGSAATVAAEMLNTRFAPAFEMVGGLIEAAIQGNKEFGKAWKELDLGAVPKGQRGFFKDMIKDMADVKEAADEMSTAVNLTITAISTGEFSGNKARESIARFGDELERIGQMDPRLAPVTDRLQGFLDAIPDGQRLQGLRQYADMWTNIVVPALEDGVVTNEEIDAIMAQLNTRLATTPELLATLAKNAGGIAPQFQSGGQAIEDFGSKLEKLDAMVASKNKNIATLGEILKGGDMGRHTGKVDIIEGTPVPETEEDRLKKEDDKRVNEQREAKGTDPSKVAEQLQGMVTTVAKMVTQVTALAIGMAKNVFAVFSAMAINVSKVIGQMAVSVFTDIGTMITNTITVLAAFTKGVPVLFAAMATKASAEAGRMAIDVFTNIGTMITNSISVISAFAKGVPVLFAAMADNSLEITVAFQTNIIEAITVMTEAVTTGVEEMGASVMLAFANTYANVMETTGTFIETMVDAIQTMADAIIESIDTMANDAVEIAINMSNNVVTAIEDMAERGGSAAEQFASDMEAAMGDVESAASDAASAVSNLADEVAELDGMSAVVTVTTNFKTTGTPPKQTGSVEINRQMGAVISAASAKSFQYGGSIETSHGPQMAIFGDNPGGQETVAFIPHDNPFPTLRKLEKLFKGRSSSDIVSKSLDRAEEMVIHATFVIENMMDGQKVGTTIARKVFRKMRTR